MTEPSREPFSAAQRFAWLRLWRSGNVGPRTFQTLLSRFGTAEAALQALPDLVRRNNPGRPIRIAAPADIERELAVAERCGAIFLCRDEPGYPDLLREIDNAPAVIAVRGRPEAAGRHADVISRGATASSRVFRSASSWSRRRAARAR